MNDFKKQLDLVLYHSDEGDVSVNAYIKDETLWITQKSMAELFDVDKSSADISKISLRAANSMKKWLLQNLQQPLGTMRLKEKLRLQKQTFTISMSLFQSVTV